MPNFSLFNEQTLSVRKDTGEQLFYLSMYRIWTKIFFNISLEWKSLLKRKKKSFNQSCPFFVVNTVFYQQVSFITDLFFDSLMTGGRD